MTDSISLVHLGSPHDDQVAGADVPHSLGVLVADVCDDIFGETASQVGWVVHRGAVSGVEFYGPEETVAVFLAEKDPSGENCTQQWFVFRGWQLSFSGQPSWSGMAVYGSYAETADALAP